MNEPPEPAISATSLTLLQRVRDASDVSAWNEFHELYSGLIYRYGRARGLNDTDALDVMGECMAILSRQMRDFEYDHKGGSFRGWLRTIVANKITDLYRKKKPARADTEDLARLYSKEKSPDELWDQQWRQNHLLYGNRHAQDTPYRPSPFLLNHSSYRLQN